MDTYIEKRASCFLSFIIVKYLHLHLCVLYFDLNIHFNMFEHHMHLCVLYYDLNIYFHMFERHLHLSVFWYDFEVSHICKWNFSRYDLWFCPVFRTLYFSYIHRTRTIVIWYPSRHQLMANFLRINRIFQKQWIIICNRFLN